ncbi:MAG TPA: hypothetical protein VL285_22940 [Bryobacteraceae bacterium]|jgi:hypothetical protein|nr:hypothetical protein [Bryobacteraceae bacterium]
MGANPTQARAVVLFFLAFVLVAAGLASGGSFTYIVAGVALLAGAGALFMKCKPWEHREE